MFEHQNMGFIDSLSRPHWAAFFIAPFSFQTDISDYHYLQSAKS